MVCEPPCAWPAGCAAAVTHMSLAACWLGAMPCSCAAEAICCMVASAACRLPEMVCIALRTAGANMGSVQMMAVS
jgi:hypothetical protein